MSTVRLSRTPGEQPKRWMDRLTDEDLMFVKRFILCSGSLKDLAAIYEISYPTVRLRLDRLIERIKVADSAEIHSEFERTARLLFTDGKIDLDTLKQILVAHRRELEGAE